MFECGFWGSSRGNPFEKVILKQFPAAPVVQAGAAKGPGHAVLERQAPTIHTSDQSRDRLSEPPSLLARENPTNPGVKASL